jgi:hypothetical protein
MATYSQVGSVHANKRAFRPWVMALVLRHCADREKERVMMMLNALKHVRA